MLLTTVTRYAAAIQVYICADTRAFVCWGAPYAINTISGGGKNRGVHAVAW